MQANSNPEMLALWYAVRGDVRFLSHRDMMRMWARAVIRAALAVCYSEGFNPHVRLALPLPRSVGMASEGELLVIRMRSREEIEKPMRSLQRQTPRGVTLIAGRWIPTNTPTAARGARYAMKISSAADLADVDRRIGEFNASPSWSVYREGGKNHPSRTVDLRQSVERIDRSDDRIEFTIRNNPDGAARIEELRQALGLAPAEQVIGLTRIETLYESPLLASEWPAAGWTGTAHES
jgi:radical SAM-linked protein